MNINYIQKIPHYKTLIGRDFFKSLILKNLPSKIDLKEINLTLYLKLDNIYYNFSKLNLSTVDTIHNYSSYIQIIVPIFIHNKVSNCINRIDVILFELPCINKFGFLLLNGIKRIFISKLIRKSGIYYNFFIKNNTKIYQAYFFFINNYSTINISFDGLNFAIYINNIKLNFILFLYFNDIQLKDIIESSRYGNTFLFKKILYNSYKDLINLKKESTLYNKYSTFFYNFIKNFFLKEENNNFNNKLLLNIIDKLIDYNFNKTIIQDKDHFGNKEYYSLKYEILSHFQFKITKYLEYLSNIKVKFKLLNKINSYKLVNMTKTNSLYKELVLNNPLVRIADDTNIVSELSLMLKIQNSGIISMSSINEIPKNLRDFRTSQLSKFCIIDTGEGPSSGLLLSLTINTFNKSNNLVSLFYNKIYCVYNKPPINLTIKQQELYLIVLNEISLKLGVSFDTYTIQTIHANNIENVNIHNKNIIFLNVEDLFSPVENLIPFIFYNEPIRCIMGAKMQTQSVPLIYKKHSLVLSGYEYVLCNIYSESIQVLQEGIVTYVSNYKIIIRDIFNREIIYYIPQYLNSQNKIIKYHKPIVWVGERVSNGQFLTENVSTKNTLLTLGNPCLVLYGSYFGYDYEDSIIIAQSLIYKNIFTSLHMDIYEGEFEYNKFNKEYSTLNVPDRNLFSQRNLNILGIIKEGAKVIEGDVLISKVTKKQISNKLKISIVELLQNIFGSELFDIIDKSDIVKKGNTGRVLKTEIFTNNSNSYLNYRIFLGNIRLLKVGDKLCGRHGNKGIISYISKDVDFPFLKTGEIPDIITGSLGVPSRMNIGQLYEGLLGLSCFYLNKKAVINYKINNIIGNNYLKLFIYDLLYKTSLNTSYKHLYNPYLPGKMNFKDGKSGVPLSGASYIGVLQYYKLIHMVKDKINYRTTGKYSQIIQQPIRGRDNGGQRFGEMEVWALEAFGVSYTIRELLSYRADDIIGRKSILNMLINTKDILKETGISETFKVTLKELQSLSINIDLFIMYPHLYENLLNTKY